MLCILILYWKPVKFIFLSVIAMLNSNATECHHLTGLKQIKEPPNDWTSQSVGRKILSAGENCYGWDSKENANSKSFFQII